MSITEKTKEGRREGTYSPPFKTKWTNATFLTISSMFQKVDHMLGALVRNKIEQRKLSGNMTRRGGRIVRRRARLILFFNDRNFQFLFCWQLLTIGPFELAQKGLSGIVISVQTT